MIGLTLKHLRYFDALARYAHFGRAAASCGISQPALSVQIKELEAMLGAPLVERRSRQIGLTALGEDFLTRARKILVDVDELNDLVRSAEGPLAGRLRLGVIPTVAPYLLPRIVTALAAQMPELDLQPKEAITRALIADLHDSRLDAAIVALPVSEPGLHETLLFEEAFLLLRPASEAGKPVPSPQSLKEMRLLLLEEGHCFRDQALSFCEINQTSHRYLMEGSSLSTLVQMVGAGMGLTLIPEMAVALETRAAPVSADRFSPPFPTRTIGMVWRRTNPLADQLTKIGGVIRAVGEADRHAQQTARA
jgi:LysR family hydrogen peroxide-inducible transcriptional activator